MVITAIERTKRGRYSLFVEGEFVFSITDEQMISDHIAIGMEISPAGLDRIKYHADVYFAKERALSLLSARSYTKKGLYRKLREKVDEEVAESTIERMEELGLLDDEEYARRKAKDLYHVSKYGRRRVVETLVQKGIERPLAQEIAEELEPEEQGEMLFSIIEKKYARVLDEAEDRNDFFKRRARVQNALVRKGYAYDEIHRAIRAYLEESDSAFL